MVDSLNENANTHSPKSKITVRADQILKQAATYLPENEIRRLRSGVESAVKAHYGQERKSGEPFVEHPLRTARDLADGGFDLATLIAGALHDVVEDCPHITNDDIRDVFGEEVAKLVDGVTKISKAEAPLEDWDNGVGFLEESDDDIAKAATIRKLIMALLEDERVAYIKFYDRLDNMRTLGALLKEKRESIARETLDIYARLADFLGMWEIKRELENLALKHLNPGAHEKISGMLKATRRERIGYIEAVRSALQAALHKAGIDAKVTGHTKSIYAIHELEERKQQPLSVNDMLTLRVIVQEDHNCYNALGVVHALWRPMPGRFDDYIENPKYNHYRSLHTTVECVDAAAVDVHIRTTKMNRVAEYGIAARWRFKDGDYYEADFKAKLESLREHTAKGKNLQEFIELMTDKFREQIYVRTPEGVRMEVPAGATVLDFAFHIYPDKAYYCSGAKVNGKFTNFDYQLQNDDVAEIMTNKAAQGADLKWLNPDAGYLDTAFGRAQVKAWFSRIDHPKNIEDGEEIFRSQILRLNPAMVAGDIAAILGYATKDDFLVALGRGVLNVREVVERITDRYIDSDDVLYRRLASPFEEDASVTTSKVLLQGELTDVILAKCSPLPGDVAYAYPNRDDSPIVHRNGCRCPSIASGTDNEERSQVEWGDNRIEYIVHLKVKARARRGLINDIVARASNEDADVEECRPFEKTEQGEGPSSVSLKVRVDGMLQLHRVCSRIEAMNGVLKVARAIGQPAPLDAESPV